MQQAGFDAIIVLKFMICDHRFFVLDARFLKTEEEEI